MGQSHPCLSPDLITACVLPEYRPLRHQTSGIALLIVVVYMVTVSFKNNFFDIHSFYFFEFLKFQVCDFLREIEEKI